MIRHALGFLAFSFTCWISPVHAQIQLSGDVASLVVIQADLDDAGKTLGIRDLDNDQSLDESEWQHLPWKDDAAAADLSGDGRITHLELALHFASERLETEVSQIDRTVAQRALNKHDKNRNGQIDAEEITSAWPENPKELDLNSDGVLTLDELTKSFAEQRIIRAEIGIIGVDQGWAIKIRNRYDADQDGQLGADEWKNVALPDDPNKFDRDQNKRLSLLELGTLFAKNRRKLNLTAKDQLQIRSVFLRVDRDFNCMIWPDELQFYARDDEDRMAQIQAWDSNEDGIVDMSEAERWVSKEREARGFDNVDAVNAQKLMSRQDRNRDGVLTLSEMKDATTSGYLDRTSFPNVDLNEDKSIDSKELAKHFMRQRS